MYRRANSKLTYSLCNRRKVAMTSRALGLG
jgi:hypothetical protein